MKNTKEFCDCCDRVVAETGFKGDTERIYRRRVRLYEWIIRPRRIGWHLEEEEWQTLCGECWDEIGQATKLGREEWRRQREQVA